MSPSDEGRGMAAPSGFVAIVGSERPPVRGAKRVADADPGEVLTATIRVRRRLDGPPMPSLDDLGKIPLNRRKFLSREEFAKLFGASDDDLASIAAFAERAGLTVTTRSAGQRTVVVSGAVPQMENAFAVKLGRYEAPTETYRGHEGPVHVPQSLGEIVESVLGLDNRRVVRPHIVAASPAPAAGAGGSPQNSPPAGAKGLTPPQVARLYNFPTNTAAGATVAIVEYAGGYSKSDITAFLKPLGIATPSIVDQGEEVSRSHRRGDAKRPG